MQSISDRISSQLLPRVARPGQYVGLETNACCGDVASAEVAVCLAFPDTYGVGISHLGSQVLYRMLNDVPGVACDRAYCPEPDAEEVCRRMGLPLFGWESRVPLRQFDVLGFSLAYELCVTNVLTMLDLAGIAIRSADRTEHDPIVVAGNVLADSPEPMADFIDLFLIGDGEASLGPFVELLRLMKRSNATRDEIILAAARTIGGAYAPRFYEPVYDQSGKSMVALRPLRPDVPAQIPRAHLASLNESPALEAPLVPLSEAVHDRVAIEIMRGCPNGCRFCHAGATALPVRWRSVQDILAIARKAVAATGYREISLLSLSTSDYPHLDELIDRLSEEFTPQRVSISLPSLRVSSQLRQLPKLTSAVRKGGLTIAAEAGSERLRRAIGKDITEEDMIAGVRAAYAAGWRSVKVYFMAGLPGETEADIDAIFELCRRLSDARREVDGQRGAITASVSWFVPKPHTPMQWAAMRQADYFFAVRSRLRELSRRTPISFRFHFIERSLLEAVIARGDRRLGAAIEAVWRSGARMDAWDEHFSYALWQEAFRQTGIDPAFYAHRQLATDEFLPWDHVTDRRGKEFLLRQWRHVLDEIAS